MTENQTHSGAHGLSFMIPLVLFVLFFVACCGVLASVFIRATQVSTDAGDLNAAVQLCRNQAERVRALGSSEASLPLVAGTETHYYDGSCREVSDDTAEYILTLTESRSAAPAGQLRDFTVTAYTAEEAQLYSLQVAVYLPDGR